MPIIPSTSGFLFWSKDTNNVSIVYLYGSYCRRATLVVRFGNTNIPWRDNAIPLYLFLETYDKRSVIDTAYLLEQHISYFHISEWNIWPLSRSIATDVYSHDFSKVSDAFTLDGCSKYTHRQNKP